MLTYTQTENAQKSTYLFNASFYKPMWEPSLMLKEYFVFSQCVIDE